MLWPPCLDRLSNKFAFHSNIRCQPAIIFYEFIGFHEIIHWMEIAWRCLLWIFFLEWFWMSLSTREKFSPAKPTALLKCGGLDKKYAGHWCTRNIYSSRCSFSSIPEATTLISLRLCSSSNYVHLCFPFSYWKRSLLWRWGRPIPFYLLPFFIMPLISSSTKKFKVVGKADSCSLKEDVTHSFLPLLVFLLNNIAAHTH